VYVSKSILLEQEKELEPNEAAREREKDIKASAMQLKN